MKTKDLIRFLQEADPTGEAIVDGFDGAIHFVEGLPGYYDGCYEYLTKEDPNDWNSKTTGYVISRTGKKILLRCYSLELFCFDHPELPVTIEGFSEEKEKMLKEKIAAWREEGRQAIEEYKRAKK